MGTRQSLTQVRTMMVIAQGQMLGSQITR